MSVAGRMLDTYLANLGGLDRDKLRECIEACLECAQACADACLSEDNVSQLIKCIRTDLDCADVCETTGRGARRARDEALPSLCGCSPAMPSPPPAPSPRRSGSTPAGSSARSCPPTRTR